MCLITSTNSFQGFKITKYITPIFASSSVGIKGDMEVSIFSKAGIGGSASLRQKSNELYTSLTSLLIETAKNYGANAVVGLKIDYTCLSGGGNNVFLMAYAQATACIVESE